MRELLIATGNQGKFKEITEALRDVPVSLFSLMDLGLRNDGLIEDGKTFKENAFKKAKFFYEKSGLLTLAEDSGILLEALLDELGVHTRRWGAGERATDEEWIEFFLKRMEREEKKEARFICNACLIGEGIEEYFEGETIGKITETLMAPILPGLPLSSCFLPEGYGQVYASLSPHEKNEVSHRGKAMKKVGAYLNII